jgi:uncharacterized protein YkwD
VKRVPRHRAPFPLRRWYVAAASAVVVLLVAIGGYLAVSGPASARNAASSGTAGVTARHCTGAGCPASSSASAAASNATAHSPSPSASARHRHHRPRPTASPSRQPATPAPSASATAAPSPSASAPATGSGNSSAAASVLAIINQARAQAGLAAYTVLTGLVTSAGKHTQLMAGGCGLSHQCPGEPALGQRETDAGVQWTAAGENIGEGGPVAATTAAITQMADALTQDMLNEKPPDDGHRLNILSSSFTHIGIVVYRGSDGTVWMTQDFSN